MNNLSHTGIHFVTKKSIMSTMNTTQDVLKKLFLFF